MSSTTSKVLTGCGVGCLLLIIFAVGASFMGYKWVKETTEAVEEAGRIERELEEAHGPARAFVPAPGPGVPEDRMEVFLAVREAMTERRNELETAVTDLAAASEGGGAASGLRAARAGVSLAPLALGFANDRNTALLDAGMGMGEYTWIYWITYFAWLGHPADDSELHEFMNKQASGEGAVQIHVDGGMEAERITWRLRRDVKAMLRNLEQELTVVPASDEMLQAIADEFSKLDVDPGRVPWQDGLPEAFSHGLEPYRERLEATYSSASNPFELMALE